MDNLEDQKTIDSLHYEIGMYLDEIRSLRNTVKRYEVIIDGLGSALNNIRLTHRQNGSYEVADSIRNLFTVLGIEVSDKPIKVSSPMSGREPSEL
jgi:cysteinyl-tRNA synthetase